LGRLTADKDIADIEVSNFDVKQYEVKVTFDSVQSNCFIINENEWQVDDRIIKWKGWTNLLGLGSFFQLDCLSGPISLAVC
jgi:hypothetical protein